MIECQKLKEKRQKKWVRNGQKIIQKLPKTDWETAYNWLWNYIYLLKTKYCHSIQTKITLLIVVTLVKVVTVITVVTVVTLVMAVMVVTT